jgi:hypothetical protein
MPALLALAALCVLATSAPDELCGQAYEGDSWTTVGGAALGLYSGGMLGLVGTMMPCNRTIQGGRCTASGVGTGAAMGLVMGGLIGAQNTDALRVRAENAGIGALVGAAVGVGLRRAVRQYGWADVGAAAVVGGAFGAAPRGSLIGFGAGTVAGAAAWWLLPDSGIADFVMLSLAGAAVGGMVEWAQGAASAKRDRPPPSFSVLSIHVR